MSRASSTASHGGCPAYVAVCSAPPAYPSTVGAESENVVAIVAESRLSVPDAHVDDTKEEDRHDADDADDVSHTCQAGGTGGPGACVCASGDKSSEHDALYALVLPLVLPEPAE